MSDEQSAAPWVPDADSDPARLAEAAQECRGCELWQDATHVVLAGAPRDARIMLVGEQPGDQEDRAGEPFVGPAGRVLRAALAEAGIDAQAVYLTNAVKHFRHRTQGKRRIHQKPDVRHVEACHPWLEAEIRSVEPAVIVCLGALAGRAVLGHPVRIGDDRGQVLEYGETTAVVVTYHPAAVLRRRPGAHEADGPRRALVADLELAARVAGGDAGRGGGAG